MLERFVNKQWISYFVSNWLSINTTTLLYVPLTICKIFNDSCLSHKAFVKHICVYIRMQVFVYVYNVFYRFPISIVHCCLSNVLFIYQPSEFMVEITHFCINELVNYCEIQQKKMQLNNHL